jgi:hypothetical protein
VHAVHTELPIIPDMMLTLKNGVPVTVTPRNKNPSAEYEFGLIDFPVVTASHILRINP